jgi:hypothetical protein
MKHVMVSLAIGTCLLLPSAGAVLGASTNGRQTPPVTGQPSQSCQTSISLGTGAAPGNSTSANSTGSPFGSAALNGTGGTSVGVYAGAPGSASANHSQFGGSTTPIAVSQYDVACTKQVH